MAGNGKKGEKVAGTGKMGDASTFKDCVCSAFSECTCSASKRGMRALSENALVAGGRKQAKKTSTTTGSDEAEKFSKEALKNVQWTQVRAILSNSQNSQQYTAYPWLPMSTF
jgi:hypothetical protein